MAERRWVRFNLATLMLLVATCAAASALFGKVREYTPNVTAGSGPATMPTDAPVLAVAAVVFTAAAFGGLKRHSARQVMLQVTLACLFYLVLIWLHEAGHRRALLYGFQVGFGLLVAAPLVARGLVKSRMPRGPRRDRWKKTLEAVVFSFLTALLVVAGAWLQALMYVLARELLHL